MNPSNPASQRSAAHVVTEWHRPHPSDDGLGQPGRDTAPVRGVSVVVCTYRRPDSMALLLDSIARQDRTPFELLIVDAGGDDEARPTRTRVSSTPALAESVHYWQVTGPARGLTRQRNFALEHVTGDLVLFLDDDVILEPECVREMEAAHRSGAGSIVGVGCYSDNQFSAPSWLWRARRAFRMVPSLTPGRYCRSGISIPWGFERPTGVLVDGNWLPGCAMMWMTEVVRAVGFDEDLEGYGQGEDLDFSLRAGTRGRLVMLGTPRLQHRHPLAGRPDAFSLGYMELRNRYEIHRRSLVDRTWRDVLWFIYAWTLDTLMLMRHLPVPGRFMTTARQIAGRAKAAADLVLTTFGRVQARDAR